VCWYTEWTASHGHDDFVRLDLSLQRRCYGKPGIELGRYEWRRSPAQHRHRTLCSWCNKPETRDLCTDRLPTQIYASFNTVTLYPGSIVCLICPMPFKTLKDAMPISLGQTGLLLTF